MTTTNTYNGDGHRMAKAVDGVTTTYVVAVIGLSQVLVETRGGQTTRYVYGHDLLAEESTAWVWHLNDGLGSVRQLIDEGGNLTLAQGYTPFGVPLWDTGSGTTGYGFTGERWEAYNELLFLRARYYDPAIGRFLSKDLWKGRLWSPQADNGWSYVEGDPINMIDPRGSDGIKIWEDIAAGTAVNLAKAVYGKAGLLRICLLNSDDGQCSSDTVNDLLTDYVCERGPEHRYFGASDHLTEQLAKSFPLCKLRQDFYLGNNDAMGGNYMFDNVEFLQATVDSLLRGDPAWYIIPWRNLDITHFMGSFEYTISRHGFDKVRFEVRNETDLASGTRIPPILGGAPVEDAERAFYVEEMLEWYPEMSTWSLGQIMEQYSIISILKPKTREQTGGILDLEGGGTMKQTFIWFEPYSVLGGCLPLFIPCPAMAPFWRIEGSPDSETSM